MTRRAPGRRDRRTGRAGSAGGRRGALPILLVVLLAALAGAPACSGQESAVGEGAATGTAPSGSEARVRAQDGTEDGAADESSAETAGDAAGETEPPAVRRLGVEVVASYPHDREAFTQGLLLESPGVLLESTGRYRRSELRRVDLASGEVMRRQRLPDELFAEGLALLPAGDDGGGNRLLQLTWRAGRALEWDAATFERLAEHSYAGEGWGLCYQPADDRLVMSDGSDRLTFRDPRTFAPTGEVRVTVEGRALGYLNELECVDGRVWANVLGLSQLFEIDPGDGRVVGIVDVGLLLAPQEVAGTDVLNGIAHDPADGTFLLTGKLWPKLFRVRFVEE